MTSWIDKTTPTAVSAVVRGDDPAALTPFCDIYCIKFFDARLHSIDCDIGNGRDPILPDRMVIRDAIAETPYSEGDDA